MRGIKTLAAILIIGLMVGVASASTPAGPFYVDYTFCGGGPVASASGNVQANADKGFGMDTALFVHNKEACTLNLSVPLFNPVVWSGTATIQTGIYVYKPGSTTMYAYYAPRDSYGVAEVGWVKTIIFAKLPADTATTTTCGAAGATTCGTTNYHLK